MKKYQVITSSISYYSLIIEAENDDEAWDLAHEADGADFEPHGGEGDWEIYSVAEVQS